MLRLLAQWASCDPATLSEERVRDYFLHLVNARSYAPKTLRQARAALNIETRDIHRRELRLHVRLGKGGSRSP